MTAFSSDESTMVAVFDPSRMTHVSGGENVIVSLAADTIKDSTPTSPLLLACTPARTHEQVSTEAVAWREQDRARNYCSIPPVRVTAKDAARLQSSGYVRVNLRWQRFFDLGELLLSVDRVVNPQQNDKQHPKSDHQ